MPWNRWAVTSAVAAAAALGLAWTQPEDGAKKDQPKEASPVAGPRPEHQQLADLCGVYDVTLTVWPRPGMDPITMKGTSTREMVLNDQFMQERLEVTGPPMPFTGLSFMGFNADAKDGPRFEVVRMSTSVPCQMPETGTFDPATKTYTLKGQHEVMGMLGKIRNEINVSDPDHQVVESYLAYDGYAGQFKGMTIPESKAMRMEYTKRK